MALDYACYALVGSEPVRKRYLLQRLRQQAGAWERVSAAQWGPEAVLAPSLLGTTDQPLVRVVDDYPKWSAAQRKHFAGALADPTPGLVVVLCVAQLGAKDALRAAVAAEALVRLESPARGGFPAWVVRQAKLAGVRLEGGVAELLVELVGEQTEALAAELDKLAAASQDGVVGVALCRALVAPSPQALVWPWVEAMLDGKPPAACQALAACEGAGEAPLALTGALHSRLLNICWVHAADQASAQSKDYPWRLAQQAVRQGWDRRRCAQALEQLVDLEHDLKGASALDGWVQLLRFSAAGLA